MQNSTLNKFLLGSATLALLSSPAMAGTCIIRGQALVSAYTVATQNNTGFLKVYKQRLGSDKHGDHRFTQMSDANIYARPGRYGAKSRVLIASKIRLKFYKNLRSGWKLTNIGYGGSPTSTRKYVSPNGRDIILETNKKVGAGTSFNIYATSLKLQHKHTSKKCGNDPVSQQIVVQQAFK